MPPTPPRDWRADVLRSLGAPVTRANLAFLAAWQRMEGGHTKNKATFNWLNTTRGTQYPRINSVGVRAYPNYAEGIRQTAATLDNGKYRNIVAGLRSGNPTDLAMRLGVAGDLQTWVSGNRFGNPQYAQRVFAASTGPGQMGTGGFTRPVETLDPRFKAGASPNYLAGSGGFLGQLDDVSDLPVVGGAIGSAAGAAGDIVTAPVDAAKAVIGGFSWLFGNWDRIFYVLGGFILLVIGLVLLARSMSSRPDRIVVAGAGSVANRIQYGPAKERLPATRDRSLSRKRNVTLAADQPAPRRVNPGASQTGDVPF